MPVIYMSIRCMPMRYMPIRCTPIRYVYIRHISKIPAHKVHAREIQAYEVYAHEIHAHRTTLVIAVQMVQRRSQAAVAELCPPLISPQLCFLNHPEILCFRGLCDSSHEVRETIESMGGRLIVFKAVYLLQCSLQRLTWFLSLIKSP
jgi:hypothetical protein